MNSFRSGHGQDRLSPDSIHFGGGASSENFFKHEIGSHGAGAGMNLGMNMGMGMGMGRPSYSMSREDMSGSSSRHEPGNFFFIIIFIKHVTQIFFLHFRK